MDSKACPLNCHNKICPRLFSFNARQNLSHYLWSTCYVHLKPRVIDITLMWNVKSIPADVGGLPQVTVTHATT